MDSDTQITPQQPQNVPIEEPKLGHFSPVAHEFASIISAGLDMANRDGKFVDLMAKLDVTRIERPSQWFEVFTVWSKHPLSVRTNPTAVWDSLKQLWVAVQSILRSENDGGSSGDVAEDYFPGFIVPDGADRNGGPNTVLMDALTPAILKQMKEHAERYAVPLNLLPRDCDGIVATYIVYLYHVCPELMMEALLTSVACTALIDSMHFVYTKFPQIMVARGLPLNRFLRIRANAEDGRFFIVRLAVMVTERLNHLHQITLSGAQPSEQTQLLDASVGGHYFSCLLGVAEQPNSPFSDLRVVRNLERSRVIFCGLFPSEALKHNVLNHSFSRKIAGANQGQWRQVNGQTVRSSGVHLRGDGDENHHQDGYPHPMRPTYTDVAFENLVNASDIHRGTYNRVHQVPGQMPSMAGRYPPRSSLPAEYHQYMMQMNETTRAGQLMQSISGPGRSTTDRRFGPNNGTANILSDQPAVGPVLFNHRTAMYVPGSVTDIRYPHASLIGEDTLTGTFQRLRLMRPTPSDEDSLYRCFFDGVISIDQFMEVVLALHSIASAPGGESSEEAAILGRIIRNLFVECRFFPRYPPHQLYATSMVLGHLMEGPVLLRTPEMYSLGWRCIAEAIRRSDNSPLYRFGIAVLRQILHTAIYSPFFCASVCGLPHLRADFPEVADYLRQCVESLPVEIRSSVVLPRTAVEAPPVKFQMVIPPRIYLVPEQQAHLNIIMAPHSGQSPDAEHAKLNDLMALYPPTVRAEEGSITLGTIENIIQISHIGSSCPEAPSHVADAVTLELNFLSESNVSQKAHSLVKYQNYLPYIALHIVKTRAMKEPNHHDLYIEFVRVYGGDTTTNIVTNIAYECLGLLLMYTDAYGHIIAYNSAIRNLASFIGALTLGRGIPLKANKCDVREMMLTAYHTGALNIVVPVIRNILTPAKKSENAIRSPWFKMMFCMFLWLKRIPMDQIPHSDRYARSTQFLSELDIFFASLGVDGDVMTSAIPTPNPFLEVPKNPKFGPTMGPVANQATSSTRPQATNVPNGAASAPPSGLPGLPTPSQMSTNRPANANANIPQAGSSNPMSLQQGGFDPHIIGLQDTASMQLINAIKNLVVVNPLLTCFTTMKNVEPKNVVAATVHRTLCEVMGSITSRGVQMSSTIAAQMVMKDLTVTGKEDHQRMQQVLRAANIYGVSLASSITNAGGRATIRQALARNFVRVFMAAMNANPATPPSTSLEQSSLVVAQDNLRIACSFIDQIVIEQTVHRVAELINAGPVTPTDSQVALDKECIASLPESLRPGSKDSDARVLDVYRQIASRLSVRTPVEADGPQLITSAAFAQLAPVINQFTTAVTNAFSHYSENVTVYTGNYPLADWYKQYRQFAGIDDTIQRICQIVTKSDEPANVGLSLGRRILRSMLDTAMRINSVEELDRGLQIQLADAFMESFCQMLKAFVKTGVVPKLRSVVAVWATTTIAPSLDTVHISRVNKSNAFVLFTIVAFCVRHSVMDIALFNTFFLAPLVHQCSLYADEVMSKPSSDRLTEFGSEIETVFFALEFLMQLIYTCYVDSPCEIDLSGLVDHILDIYNKFTKEIKIANRMSKLAGLGGQFDLERMVPLFRSLKSFKPSLRDHQAFELNSSNMTDHHNLVSELQREMSKTFADILNSTEDKPEEKPEVTGQESNVDISQEGKAAIDGTENQNQS